MNRHIHFLILLVGLLFTTLAATPAYAQKTCGDGMKLKKGKCECEDGKTPSADKKSCVAQPSVTSGKTCNVIGAYVDENGNCTCGKNKKASLEGRCVSTKISTTTDKIPGASKGPIAYEGRIASGDSVPANAQVQIVDLGKDDLYYANLSELRGKKGVVYPTKLFKSGKASKGDFYEGTINFDGIEYYFAKVSVSIVKLDVQPGDLSGKYSFVPSKTKIKIVDVSSDDLFYTSKSSLVGQTCEVGAEGLLPTGGKWYGGPVTCSDGLYWYFYQFSFDVTKEATNKGGEGCVASASKTLPPAYSAVEVLDLSSLDYYSAEKKNIIGKKGKLSTDVYASGGSCWFGGTFLADDGTTYYFYQAQLKVLSDTSTTTSVCKSNASYAASFAVGQKVTILDIDPSDAYYKDRSALVGLVATVTSELRNAGSCWFGGILQSDNGNSYFFNKAQFAAAQETVAASGNYKEGDVITITSASLSDTQYYGLPSNGFDGKSCVIGSGGLSQTEIPGHFFGTLFCNGVSYYFYDITVKSGGSATANAGYKEGDSVKITTASLSDTQYYGFAANGFDGKTCIVGTGGLFSNGVAGHFFGTLFCDGLAYYFYDVTIGGKGTATPEPTTPKVTLGARFSGTSVNKGSKIQIVEISSSDMEYKSRNALVGQYCTVINDNLTSTGSGWLGGEVSCSDGKIYYFFQFAVSLGK